MRLGQPGWDRGWDSQGGVGTPVGTAKKACFKASVGGCPNRPNLYGVSNLPCVRVRVCACARVTNSLTLKGWDRLGQCFKTRVANGVPTVSQRGVVGTGRRAQ